MLDLRNASEDCLHICSDKEKIKYLFGYLFVARGWFSHVFEYSYTLSLFWPILLSYCTGSDSGTIYHCNNAKASISAEICDALDGFVARNIALQPNFPVPTWLRTLARVEIRVTRASAPTLLSCDSVCTFYPVLLLIHDLELNTGPPSSLRKKTKKQKGQRYYRSS